MAFTGWPVEAIEFYEGLEDDNSRAYWHAHKAVYAESVKGPMEALLAELEDDFGPGRVFRPNRDVRFSNDKTPYKLNCAAQLTGGYVSLSADELFVGSGLYMPMPDDLKRFRAAIDADRSGAELEAIVAALRKAKYDVGAHETLEDGPARLPEGPPAHRLAPVQGHRDVEGVAGGRLAGHQEGEGPRHHDARGSPSAQRLDPGARSPRIRASNGIAAIFSSVSSRHRTSGSFHPRGRRHRTTRSGVTMTSTWMSWLVVGTTPAAST